MNKCDNEWIIIITIRIIMVLKIIIMIKIIKKEQIFNDDHCL